MLYVHSNDITYFDSFGVEHIPKVIRTFINNKNIKKIFSEYKHMFNIFVLVLLILCLQEKP